MEVCVDMNGKAVSFHHLLTCGLVRSMPMSASAEERNVEFGLRLEDPVLTRAVEERMHALEPLLYERVRPCAKGVDD